MKYFSKQDRAILREMVSSDFKVRYQGSVLGYFWSLLKPLLLFAVLYVLFTYVAPIGQGIEHYGVSLLLGIVFWNFFSEATMSGASSIVSHGDLLRKVSIPRHLVVLASSFSALINLGLSFIVIVIFALINGVMPSFSWLLIPFVALELFIFALGISFVLSTAYVRFRDVNYIWEVLLQAGFYASMIIIPISIVPTYLHKWFFLNPVVQIVQDARSLLLPDTISPTIWNTVGEFGLKIIPFIIIITICLIGFYYFRSRSKYFAEDI